MSTITKISSCTTTACSFTTFATVDLRAGMADAEGQVGACKRLDCAHNEDLMCGLADITVTGDAALCGSYEAR